MPTVQDILQNWNTESEAMLRHAYLPALYKVTKDQRGKSYLTPRVRRTQEGVQGLKAFLAFQTRAGHGWRPMSRLGYLPHGSPFAGAQQEITLGMHAAGLQATIEDIYAYAGNNSVLGDLLKAQMSGLMDSLPLYMRNLLWLPSSGILGVAASISGTTVTLDNAGLQHTSVYDLTKYFVRDDWVQTYTSAGVKKGDPVRVVWVDRERATIHLSSDPGIVDNDFFVTSDIVGRETAYNQFGPGMFDIIDNDNTFQGVDRSQTANAWARAWVYQGATPGTGEAPTYDNLSEFFHQMFMPDIAVTSWRVIQAYFKNEFKSNVRFEQAGEFIDGFSSIKIDKTRLIEDDDALSDRIVVPDLANMMIFDKGEVMDMMGQGWKLDDERPTVSKHLMFFAAPAAKDCRNMGMRLDINPDASAS